MTQATETFSTTEFVPDEEQQLAIDTCCDVTKRLVAVSGQAGSGKTTLQQAVYKMLKAHGYSVVMCAPTGKAAKRMQEATGVEAITMHRLLQYPHPGDIDSKTGKALEPGLPAKNRNNKLEYDIVLADEYAMVNHELHRNLIEALPAGGCIRMFGDKQQLQPIEANYLLSQKDTPFEDILKRFHGIKLTKNYRQGAGSGIAENGQRIIAGRCPSRFDDFCIKITAQPIDYLRALIFEMLDEGIDMSALTNQVIVPTNVRWVGAVKVNALLQTIFRSEKIGWMPLERHSYAKDQGLRVHVGDKVINTKNNYELEVFNGETGVIIEINEAHGEIVVDFGDREVLYPPFILVQNKYKKVVEIDPRKDLELAYALTTHKTQGSEYENVIYILNKATRFMQCRSNFYTAITRARKLVHFITDQPSMSFSVNNVEPLINKQNKRR